MITKMRNKASQISYKKGLTFFVFFKNTYTKGKHSIMPRSKVHFFLCKKNTCDFLTNIFMDW